MVGVVSAPLRLRGETTITFGDSVPGGAQFNLLRDEIRAIDVVDAGGSPVLRARLA